MAVLNGSGALLSGSDAVLFRTGLDGAPPSTDCDAPAVMQLESVSGRFQPDGSSCGTRWRSAATDDGRDEDVQWESVRSDASAADAGWLRSVLVDLLRRAPAESH